MMTFDRFNNELINVVWPNKPKYIRKGQALMNYLADVWFEEYKRISSVHFYDQTDIDCFHRDNLIDNTLAHLKRQWVNYPD